MKKSEWVYLAKVMWSYSERIETSGKVSRLLKELIININKNKEMIDNDMGEYEQDARSDRPIDYNSTGSKNY